MRAAQQSARSKTTPAAGAPQTGVSGQASAFLDKAIEKCAKVISVYPKSKWVDDAILMLGECYYQKHDYDKAMRKFSELTIDRKSVV